MRCECIVMMGLLIASAHVGRRFCASAFATTTFLPSARAIRSIRSHARLLCSADGNLPPSKCTITKRTFSSVNDTLTATLEQFQAHQTPEPMESTIHLMAKVLDLDWMTGWKDLRSIILIQGGKPSSKLARRTLTEKELNDLQALVERRIQTHEPIQYLIGQWDFLDWTLEIQPPLLCPRPETEELVGLVLGSIRSQHTQTSSVHYILDVGAGTGCIGLALAASLPQVHVVAIDPEPVAVQVSKRNAQRVLSASGNLDRRYEIHQTTAQDYQPRHRLDVVVSNPPYIPKIDMDTLEETVVRHESWSALCGGEDGLDVVRDIVHQLPHWCRKGALCWMEVDPIHPAMIQQWLSQDPHLGVEYVTSISDLFGMERFVQLRVTEER